MDMPMNGEASDIHALSTDRLALTVDPAFGARVLSLTDLASGRQWLLQGPRARDVSEGAPYLGEASRGWDECFPTVLSCEHAAWGGWMRDHGMLWGRAWEVTGASLSRLSAVIRCEGFSFARTLTLQGECVTADYAVTSELETPFPYLWSQHCVLSLTPDDRIVLAGHGKMRAHGVGFDWPNHPARDLSRVGQIDEGFALKSYTMSAGLASAAIRGLDGGLRFDWNGAEIPAFGLWLDYGGWPAGIPLHQVALEPTTGAADDLAGAEATGQARWLAPGATHTWSVRLSLTGPQDGEGE
jgi:hypothetical protein